MLDKIRQATLKLQHWQECYRCAENLRPSRLAKKCNCPPNSRLMRCLSYFMAHCKGSSLELIGSSPIRTVRTGFELPIKNPDFDLLTDRFCFVSEDPNQEHLCTTCMENNSFVEVKHGWKPGLQVFQSS